MRGLVNVVRRIDAILDTLDKAGFVISSAALVLVTLVITAGAFNRAFLGMIWVFVEEWSGLALIPMSYLVMGYALRWDKHMRVDLLVKKLPARWQHGFAIFAAGLSLVCLGFMIERSWDWFAYTLKEQVTSSGPMRTPLWLFSASILLGLGLFALDMALFLVNRLFRLFLGESPLRFHGEEEPAVPHAQGAEK